MSRRFAGLASATAILVTTLPTHAVDRAAGQPGHGGMETLRCEYGAPDVPEFGGAYLEEWQTDGALVLHVWLTDVNAVDDALTALRERCPDHEDVVVREADYTYAQLSGWQAAVMSWPGVTLAGIDTRINRLTVGVADLEARRRHVGADLAGLGVPADAVNLVESSGAIEIPIRDPVSYQPLVTLAAAAAGILVLVVAIGVIWVRRRRTG